MPPKNQDTPDDKTLEAIFTTLSQERFGRYLSAAGHDHLRALSLYLWNAKLGESFHLPIQAVEVGLRNHIHQALCREYGNDWWESRPFLQVIDSERKNDLDLVLRRIRNRRLRLGCGQVVAGLSFGFWAGMLHRRYYPPIWAKHLHSCFPHLPLNRSRKSFEARVKEVAFLRNRISHHEPIFDRDISQDYATIMMVLEWICPAKAAWIRPHCRVQEVLRQKP